MGQRQLLKEGVLYKAKSGRKLRGFLCSDIIVLTDDTAKTLYRMVRRSVVHSMFPMAAHMMHIQPIPLAGVQVKEIAGGRGTSLSILMSNGCLKLVHRRHR